MVGIPTTWVTWTTIVCRSSANSSGFVSYPRSSLRDPLGRLLLSLRGGKNADYMTTTRAAIYARVSTTDQTCENQLLELRRYCEARGWTGTEFVDTGISGAKDKRPALDGLLEMRSADGSMSWSAGGSTGSDATSGTS